MFGRIIATPRAHFYLSLILSLLALGIILQAYSVDTGWVYVPSHDKVMKSEKPGVVRYVIRGPRTTSAIFEITLTWNTNQPLEQDYRVTLSLVNHYGSFSMDHYPAIPTSEWKGLVRDGPQIFLLPENLVGEESIPPPVISYRLLVGLENPVTHEKIPLANEGPLDDSFTYEIGTFTVVSNFLYVNIVGTSMIFLFVLPLAAFILAKKYEVNIFVPFLMGVALFFIYIFFIIWLNPLDMYSLSIPFSSLILSLVFAMLYVKNRNFTAIFLSHLVAVVFLSGFFIVGRLPLPFGLGNDIFFHTGNVRNILAGQFCQDYATPGLPSFYTRGFHGTIAFSSLVSGAPYLKVMLFFPIVLRALTIPSFYVMGKAVKGKTLGLVFAFVGTFYNFWLMFFGVLTHPRGFALIMPLVVYTFIKSKEDKRMSLFCALFLAAQFYIHIVMFVPLFLGISIYILVERTRRFIKKSEKNLNALRPLHQFMIPVSALLFTIPHYLPIILMRTPVLNPDPLIYYWTVRSTTTLETVLFFFESTYGRPIPVPDIFTIMTFLGLILCVLKARRPEKVILIIFISALFVRVSYMFSIPTFATSHPIYYFYQAENQLWLLNTFFVSYFLVFLAQEITRFAKLTRETNIGIKIDMDKQTSLVLICVILSPAVYFMPIQDYSLVKRDVVVFGQSHMPNLGNLLTLYEWINNNTEINDVILTFPSATSHLLIAMTGRKPVALHFEVYVNPYINQTNRKAEAMQIYYSDNTTEIVTLLRKYSVKYIVVGAEAPDNFSRYVVQGLFSIVYNDRFIYKVYKVNF